MSTLEEQLAKADAAFYAKQKEYVAAADVDKPRLLKELKALADARVAHLEVRGLPEPKDK